MLTSYDSRKGSALLIVLGMFSFMLVSAVAFSVYMRASRAPSSYVRRNAAARHLTKAALAHAMDEIDMAIGNDPFPGVGFNHNYGATGLNDSDEHKNDNWHGHVLTPSNEVAAATTVSTLTLEALGYLPPCLIDEVRYWSRHSRTAKWHSFNYGAGQFAFTAVNVSDFFDISQFMTESDGIRKPYLNRNSAPHGRISPTYLFRGSNESAMDSGNAGASAFLTAMADGNVFGGNPSVRDVPFVSMMDFNLALGDKVLGSISSPFIRRLKGSTGFFYHDEEAVRRQVFIAGGWNSDTNLTYAEYSTLGRINLRYPEYQPFDGYSWFPEQTTLSHCYNDVAENHPFWQPVNEKLPVLATALLCDYLDYDRVPLSLCIPCTEAVPMLCGVELNDGCVKYNVKMDETELAAANPEQGTKKKIKRTYSIHVELNSLEPTITAVYPFLCGDQGRSATFKTEAFARVFFTADSGDAWVKGLRAPNNAGLGLGTGFTWGVANDSSASAFLQTICGERPVDGNRAIDGVGEAAEQSAIQGDIALRSSGTVSKDAMLAELVFEVDENGTETLLESECNNGTDFNFYDGSWGTVNFLEKLKADVDDGVKYWPSVAIWVRIKSSDGDKTVDMVPAIPDYDSLNGFAANASLNHFNLATTGDTDPSNIRTPLLRFFPKVQDAAKGIVLIRDYFKNNNGANRDAEWAQKAYIANDPRINWAPEQWWADVSGGDPKDLWFTNVKNFRQASTLRDPDIFMSVSDQGYMQSMYEWLMIPQVRSLKITANAEWGAFEQGLGYDGVVRANVNDVLHNDLMWRTYRSNAFAFNDSDLVDVGSIDDPDNGGIPFDDAENGLRVNPYTDITNVMLGAFANMPRDWWAASTNYNADGKNYMNGAAFKKDYLFEWSYEYQDVYKMAAYWMGAFRRLDNQEAREKLHQSDAWQDVFEDAWNWYEGRVNYAIPNVSTADIEGILQDDMTFADRKFFYGYLKGCFANRAQLFLVFVRAESAAGGGGAGSGGRAVALVWRDPRAPMEAASGQYKKASGGSETPQYGKDNASKYLNVNNNVGAEEAWRMNQRDYPPHKMRVLFYHQLD